MTKEEPDQLINALARTSYPLASSGAVRRRRPGGSGSRSCSLRFFGSPVIASASASRCCGSRASLASRYVHGTFF